MKKNISNIYISLFVFLNSAFVFAQPGAENSEGNLETNDPTAAPIENNFMILLMLLAIFSICFLKLKKTNKYL